VVASSPPTSGTVYVDSVVLIYTVERFAKYWPVLRKVWQSLKQRQVRVISSELALLETLVGPLKAKDARLCQLFEQMLLGRDMRLVPISQLHLREAASLRASIAGLRTPDAIHAATAIAERCSSFLTNDMALKRIPGLPVTVLDELPP
jgi:predicted nucleic acid-binding protein